jgi:PAS domain-containing protein
VGSLSQKDILTRVILLRRNPTRTPVAEVMSTPILPIPPDYSVFTASRIMNKMRIHRLVVQDTQRIYGIVSQTDILHALEKRLAEEEKHRLFLVCSDIPMFMLDAAGVVTYANAAFLRLFDRESQAQVLGTALSDARYWSGPADRERLLGMLARGKSGMLGMVAMTGTGRLKRIVVLLTVTRNGRDEVDGWQGVAWCVAGRRGPRTALCHSPGVNAPQNNLPDV